MENTRLKKPKRPFKNYTVAGFSTLERLMTTSEWKASLCAAKHFGIFAGMRVLMRMICTDPHATDEEVDKLLFATSDAGFSLSEVFFLSIAKGAFLNSCVEKNYDLFHDISSEEAMFFSYVEEARAQLIKIVEIDKEKWS